MSQRRALSPSFFTWSWRYLRRYPSLLAQVALGVAVVLFCQVTIPLRVEHILEEGEWHLTPILILTGLIIIQLGVAFLVLLRAHRIAIESAEVIRGEMYQSALLDNNDGLSRTEIAIRHTGDVENVKVAIEKSLAEGIPGAIRIVLSLIFLSIISPPAGIIMMFATVIFLILRSLIARRLYVLDQAQLAEISSVATSVDEAIISAQPLRGLSLIQWAQARFDMRLVALSHTAHRIGVLASQVHTGAHTAGLLGLLVVVVIAVGGLGENAGVIAASLLYIEGVVRGLEALPGWIRSVQVARASVSRIQQVLDWHEPEATAGSPSIDVASIEIPTGVTGVVVPASQDIEVFLGQVRQSLGNQAAYVTANPLTLDASIADLFTGSDPQCNVESFLEICELLGLDLIETTAGGALSLNTNLSFLTVNDRQRLALALAVAKKPQALLVGPILALSDPDSNLHLGELVQRFDIPRVVYSLKVPEQCVWAESVVFLSPKGPVVGQHQALLQEQREYAQLWESRLNAQEVDLTSLGLEGDSADALQAKLVTERHSSGEFIYRGGELADRIVFLISGRIEISVNDTDGSPRRVAVVGPGAHCGDLRLTVGERRTENAVALEDSVVRTLSREAISVGLMGLLDRSPLERKIVSTLLRNGSMPEDELLLLIPESSPEEFKKAFALLISDGAITQKDGMLRVQQKRAVKSGTDSLFDLLS